MDIIERDILLVLAYFDMFHYPLSEKEIKLFLQKKNNGLSISNLLRQLVLNRTIFCFEDFYCLHDDLQLVKKRLQGNQRATADLLIAYRVSKFLYNFPFIRGISISGSLSKNFSVPDSDIDYFIITQSGRLWIARTFLHIFKKITFLFGAQHHFCMNYFIDEDALEIEEKNLFTAIETVTLLPVCGNGAQHHFFSSNQWTLRFLPNCNIISGEKYYTGKRLLLKKMLEFLLNKLFGDYVDNKLMTITSRRWGRKERKEKLNMKGNRMGIICEKHCCKPNPIYFQNEILSKYKRKVDGLIMETVR